MANLRRDALRTLFGAMLQLFTRTDAGVIGNLLSQDLDLDLIDIELATALLIAYFCVSVSGLTLAKFPVMTLWQGTGVQALGQAAVMLTSSPHTEISYPLLGILLYALPRYHLRTSTQPHRKTPSHPHRQHKVISIIKNLTPVQYRR